MVNQYKTHGFGERFVICIHVRFFTQFVCKQDKPQIQIALQIRKAKNDAL